MVAFWGYEVTETKAAVVDVPEGFVLNVVNATSTGDAQVALGLETQQLDGKSFKGVVAHLGAKQPLQVKLDLVFGHKVKFYLAKGSGTVNLTGYFQAGPVLEIEEGATVSETSKKSKKRAREEQKSWDEVRTEISDLCLVIFPICKLPPWSFYRYHGGPDQMEEESVCFHGKSSSCLNTQAWSLRLSPCGRRARFCGYLIMLDVAVIQSAASLCSCSLLLTACRKRWREDVESGVH
ncbi:hypothetical protein P3T76_011988 [Phytophthora citrophthora]|uniref:Nucleoplasmin-like domain-containing protein n=1 Tax=Phytophthora citrophthora TaxID=4793 RepID=A0AAD9G5W3_9STRA|nr:hypothetical protein P3T76_011988 [Phytophthora citrophthora]